MEPLIAVFKYKEPDVRREAAIALVSLYSSDKLDDRDKQSILALRSVIIGTSRPHSDGGHEVNCEWQHSDTLAIIVEFPL